MRIGICRHRQSSQYWSADWMAVCLHIFSAHGVPRKVYLPAAQCKLSMRVNQRPTWHTKLNFKTTKVHVITAYCIFGSWKKTFFPLKTAEKILSQAIIFNRKFHSHKELLTHSVIGVAPSQICYQLLQKKNKCSRYSLHERGEWLFY